MARYPRGARGARIKCIACNAPTTETVTDGIVCVECGRRVIDRQAVETSGD